MNPQETDLIYLDNAATSWPKPPEVARAISNFIEHTGANPGRSGHRLSVDAARMVYDTREAAAQLFNAPDPLRVVFSANITEAINLALYGLLRPGDHVIASGMEHNAVMRPLRHLERQGVTLTVVPCSAEGRLNPQDVANAMRPNTRLIALNHASNVCGTLQPVQAVGRIASSSGALLLLDTAQSAGAVPVDMQANLVDLLAFTGHKSLYGPTGTGGLILGPRVNPSELHPLKRGGTGSKSEHEEQPDFLPDRYESGTPNAFGLAGLNAALNWLSDVGIEAVHSREMALCAQLINGLQAIPGVQFYGPPGITERTATVAININGLPPSAVGLALDEEYGILCRVGLHCAPLAHRTLGTFPTGVVRLGIGYFNTPQQIEHTLQAIESLARSAQ